MVLFIGCENRNPNNLGKIALSYQQESKKIIDAILSDSVGFNRVAELCDTFGPRLSGSENLEKAILWIMQEMKKDGIDLARRTVAKYREIMKIPSSAQRKRQSRLAAIS